MMQKKISCVLLLLLFVFITCSAESKLERKLKNNPEFVSMELLWSGKHGKHYKVILTNNRILEFDRINPRTGGGKDARLWRIGEYDIWGVTCYKSEDKWRYNTYGSVCIKDLKNIVPIKTETILDVVDNYDEIFEAIKKLAKDQFLAGYNESIKLQEDIILVDDEYMKNKFPQHILLENNRKAIICVTSIYGYPQWVWDGIQENEVEYSKGLNYKLGEDWLNNIPYDEIRKSLDLE